MSALSLLLLLSADPNPVVLDGIPPLPPEIRTRMTPYLNTRAASVVSVSDKGDQLLIATRFGSTAQLHRLARPMGARQQLTFEEEPVVDADFVPGRTDQLIYSMDQGGNENYQLYLLDLTSHRTTRLTDGKSRNLSAVFSTDGKQLAFASNARNGKDMDLWLSDGRDPASAKLVLERSGNWGPVEWSKDGKRLLISNFRAINDSEVWVYEVATGALTRVTPEGKMVADRLATFGESSDVVYLVSDREGEVAELYRVGLKGGAFYTSLSRQIPWDVEDVVVSPDKRTIAFTVNEAGQSRLYLTDPKGRPPVAVPHPVGLIGGLQFATARPILAFSWASATTPGDAFTYDLRTKQLERWTDSELGGLDPKKLGAANLIEVKSFDDRKIPAFYHRPAGPGPYPVVINIHGGPEAQARPWFAPLTQYLVSELNVAVLVPNVRGSNGYGKTYLTLDDGMKREDSVKDIGALLDWIAQQPELDAKRVAVYGGSYGGYMVLASLAHYGDRLKAGVEIVGISNFVTFLENTSEYRRDLRRVEYGDERDPKMRAFLQQISPTNNVQKLKSALFVAQGANDPRVPASEAEQIVAAVRKNGRPVWYMLAKNEGHGFAKKENRDTFNELTVLFLQQHLLK